jgi:RimJ/RimL family protein N-acetyltransferase
MKDIILIEALNSNDSNIIDYLYASLARRERSVNISHKKMPSYVDHYTFVRNSGDKYLDWQVMLLGRNYIGHYYITKNNEVGIFIEKEHRGKGFGKFALDQIELFAKDNNIKTIFANVAVHNNISQDFFLHHKFILIQLTYSLTYSLDVSASEEGAQ